MTARKWRVGFALRPQSALVRASTGGVSARRPRRHELVSQPPATSEPLDRTSIVTTHAQRLRLATINAHAVPRVRRKRQRLGPNGSIESDPASTSGLEACAAGRVTPDRVLPLSRPMSRPVRG